jgi:DNA-binding winged helix-turn-helix (wHTH) protein/tetratricopeptide (TPR) repeat protein
MKNAVYRFGRFRLDATDRLLYREDQLVPLPPKVLDTLLLLVTGKGRVLTKSDLIQQLWPDTFVEEGTLTQYVSLLRKALGPDGAWIETLPRRGYRFTEPVEELRPETLEERDESRPSIDEPVVHVRRQASRAQAGIVICALLTLTGAVPMVVLWNRGPQTSGTPSDLPTSRGDSEGRLALAQHRLYHTGYAGAELLRASIANANRALSVNANSAAAVRAVVHIQHSTGRPVEGLLLARRALDHDPSSLDAIEAGAEAYFRTGQYDRSADLYKKALTLEPDNSEFRRQLARMHLFRGEYQKGLDALAALPISEAGPFGMALFLEAGQRGKAIAAVKSHSHDYFSAYFGGCVLDQVGDHPGAHALWTKGANIALDLLSRHENPYTRVFLGVLYGKLGMRDRAVEQVHRALESDPHHPTFLYFAAKAHAILGDRDRAIELLMDATENGFSNVFMLDYHQRPGMAFFELRNDPALQAVRAQMARRVEELRRIY